MWHEFLSEVYLTRIPMSGWHHHEVKVRWDIIRQGREASLLLGVVWCLQPHHGAARRTAPGFAQAVCLCCQLCCDNRFNETPKCVESTVDISRTRWPPEMQPARLYIINIHSEYDYKLFQSCSKNFLPTNLIETPLFNKANGHSSAAHFLLFSYIWFRRTDFIDDNHGPYPILEGIQAGAAPAGEGKQTEGGDSVEEEAT